MGRERRLPQIILPPGHSGNDEFRVKAAVMLQDILERKTRSPQEGLEALAITATATLKMIANGDGPRKKNELIDWLIDVFTRQKQDLPEDHGIIRTQ